MHNGNKAGGVVGTIPRKYGSSGYTSYKTQKDMHLPVQL